MSDTALDHRGGFFMTYTGLQFYPTDPRVEEMSIIDIAHALSQVNRFGGHTLEPYSVAQHSVLVSWLCTDAPYQGLMHDATEAYCGDMVRPLKRQLPAYEAVEEKIWNVVCSKFGLPPQMHKQVKWADNVLLMTERRDLLKKSPVHWGTYLDQFVPLPEVIVPWDAKTAEKKFLQRFEELYH